MNPIVERGNGDYRQNIDRRVQNVIVENRSWKDRYKALMNCLESGDPLVAMKAKKTLLAMHNQALAMENVARDKRLEATFTQALGQLVPRVIDVVRVFYPNLIAQDLVDIQPLDRQNGEIFTVKPIFTNSGAGVTAGQEVFKNPTDGTYASTKINVAVGTGDGTEDDFGSTLAPAPVRPGTFSVAAGAVTGTDNGAGLITGTGITSGTINYTTGVWTVKFATAPAAAVPVTATYSYDSEANPSGIREVEIKLANLPVTAEPHPLRIAYSTQSELAASSHLDLDIGDILTNLVGSLIKNERDILLANLIIAAATAVSTLNFDAAAPSNYSRLAKYAEFEAKLDAAESQIQLTNGRGGVSWVLCGSNVANVIRHCTSFQDSGIVAPIGPYRCGTLRDGTVPVIKVPTMNANTYVFGFKGYVVGDAATILAEWIPLYASPLFRSYDLNNYQGMMSLYALVQNNPGYYVKGQMTNYGA